MINRPLTLFFHIGALAFFIAILSSCNIYKYVPEGDKLYTGHEIRLESEERVFQKNEVQYALEDVTGPNPNKRLLGMRANLWIYNITGGPDSSGIKAKIQKRLGEAPVLKSQVRPERVIQLMENRLINHGHFQYIIEYEIIENEKKASIVYRVEIEQPYRIRRIVYPQGNSEIEGYIRESQAGSLLAVARPYNLNQLVAERVRIDRELRNNGYYNFNADYLLFQADTSVGERLIDLFLVLKPTVPREGSTRYILRNVLVEILPFDHEDAALDSSAIGPFKFVMPENSYRRGVLLRSNFLRPGEPYQTRNHISTIGRFMSLQTFSFVTISYEPEITNGDGILDAHIKVTPNYKRSMRGEIQAVSKSNSFIGPSIAARFVNRNAFRGAEVLSFNFSGGYEMQIIRRQRTGLTSYEIGAEGHLEVPDIMVPFFEIQTRRRFVPKTNFRLGVRHLNRTNYFSLNALNASAGYSWRQSSTLDFMVNPVNINFLQLARQDEEFIKLLEANPFFRRSFEQQFIVGGIYSMIYNSQLRERPEVIERPGIKHHTYLQTTLDFSGNALQGIFRLLGKETDPEESPGKILGSAFSQYSRLDVDLRQYLYLKNKSSFAGRLQTGIGIAYGNSTTMPYVKQFYTGGPNSIRAFRARSVGPGAYKADDDGDFFFPDQVGDIRLEASLEYRFPIISILKGAVFFDAGNVWLLKENEERPEGVFYKDRFLSQIAVGTGIGLRLDVSFFILRLDVGMPVRLPHHQAWVFDEIAFGSKAWRLDNLVYNIAIGYPF